MQSTCVVCLDAFGAWSVCEKVDQMCRNDMCMEVKDVNSKDCDTIYVELYVL